MSDIGGLEGLAAVFVAIGAGVLAFLWALFALVARRPRALRGAGILAGFAALLVLGRLSERLLGSLDVVAMIGAPVVPVLAAYVTFRSRAPRLHAR